MVLGVAAGVGLAAACGFRVFLPLLVAGLGARYGHLPLGSGSEWIATTPALIAFATASLLEIVVYYVPWLDHVADAVAAPAAVVAGIVVAAAPLLDLPPLAKWTIAVIFGGGAAGVFQGLTVLLRAKSALFTAGIGNPVVSTLELGVSIVVAIVAVLLPLACIALVIGLLFVILRVKRRAMSRVSHSS